MSFGQNENHRIRFLESVIQIERKNQSKGNEKFKIISYNKFNITPIKRKTINKISSDMNKKDKTKNQTNIWKGNYFYLPKKRELFIVEQFNFQRSSFNYMGTSNNYHLNIFTI